MSSRFNSRKIEVYFIASIYYTVTVAGDIYEAEDDDYAGSVAAVW
ncbi:MAG: hypothetical protein ACD_39C00443G0005 [uncultured bacterium]|nr:MAG: hypothetical protein ACD_39C00443G0005 [uncultured bacterium]